MNLRYSVRAIITSQRHLLNPYGLIAVPGATLHISAHDGIDKWLGARKRIVIVESDLATARPPGLSPFFSLSGINVKLGSAYPLRSGRPIVIDNLGAGRRIVECAEPKQCLERRHRCAPTVVAKHVLVEVNGQVRL